MISARRGRDRLLERTRRDDENDVSEHMKYIPSFVPDFCTVHTCVVKYSRNATRDSPGALEREAESWCRWLESLTLVSGSSNSASAGGGGSSAEPPREGAGEEVDSREGTAREGEGDVREGRGDTAEALPPPPGLPGAGGSPLALVSALPALAALASSSKPPPWSPFTGDEYASSARRLSRSSSSARTAAATLPEIDCSEFSIADSDASARKMQSSSENLQRKGWERAAERERWSVDTDGCRGGILDAAKRELETTRPK
jgi:hypothetical protein